MHCGAQRSGGRRGVWKAVRRPPCKTETRTLVDRDDFPANERDNAMRGHKKCWYFLFEERTIERKAEGPSEKPIVTISRSRKCCIDSFVHSLAHLVLAIGLVIAGCTLSCNMHSGVISESVSLKSPRQLQDAEKQISETTAALSNEVANPRSTAKKCSECAKQLSASADELRGMGQNGFLPPCCQLWCPWCVKSRK